jgi:hypothetical protein
LYFLYRPNLLSGGNNREGGSRPLKRVQGGQHRDCPDIPSGPIMIRVPWISLVLVGLICVSPLGQEVYRGLHSGEQLARSMSQIVIMIYGPILLVIVLAECGIRIWINARRRKAANSTES